MNIKNYNFDWESLDDEKQKELRECLNETPSIFRRLFNFFYLTSYLVKEIKIQGEVIKIIVNTSKNNDTICKKIEKDIFANIIKKFNIKEKDSKKRKIEKIRKYYEDYEDGYEYVKKNLKILGLK
jgi:hypothetical protein